MRDVSTHLCMDPDSLERYEVRIQDWEVPLDVAVLLVIEEGLHRAPERFPIQNAWEGLLDRGVPASVADIVTQRSFLPGVCHPR